MAGTADIIFWRQDTAVIRAWAAAVYAAHIDHNLFQVQLSGIFLNSGGPRIRKSRFMLMDEKFALEFFREREVLKKNIHEKIIKSFGTHYVRVNTRPYRSVLHMGFQFRGKCLTPTHAK